jgi:hypothetical protein
MIDTLKELAVDKTFDGKDTSGIKDARDLIEIMFDTLEQKYAPEKEPIIKNSK